MKDLKPCPFCGGDAEFSWRKGHTTKNARSKLGTVYERTVEPMVRARCKRCHASNGHWSLGEERAAIEWNTRVKRTSTMQSTGSSVFHLGDDYVCSECGSELTGFRDGTPFAYCPTCGAEVVE